MEKRLDLRNKSETGAIVDDYKSKASLKLIVMVNSDEYAKGEVHHKQWKEAGTYELLFRDCVSYIETIAKNIGLEIPPAF